ncbi:MAG TPA: hypothetical protein VFH73_24420 [Polyangia bacterium]|jgi:hypothetical protein|nr:hypothetical protein [Polyangia bacterium]
MTLLVYTLLSVATANLGGGCPIRLLPADAPGPWLSAASALERSLQDRPSVDRDCLEVVVHAATAESPGIASVEVITADGRHGIRYLADARDLEPTVTALIVTVAPDLMATPAAEDAANPAAEAATPGRWRPVLFAGGGARLTLPSAPAPVVELMAGVTHDAWELGLFGSWAPTFIGSGASTRAGYTSAAELGASIAQRRPLRAVDMIGGLRVSAVGLWNYTPPDNMPGEGTGNFGEPTPGMTLAPALSGFLGTSIPVSSAVRLRPQLSLQWIPLGISTQQSNSIWSIGLGLGAESRVP